MAFDEHELAGQRELARLGETRIMYRSIIGFVLVVCFAIIMALPNHFFTLLLVILGSLCYTWLYTRVLRNIPIYRHLYRVMRLHYRGENGGDLPLHDNLAGAISHSDRQKFEALIREYDSET